MEAEAESMEKGCLLAGSTCILIQPSTTWPGVDDPQWQGPSHINHEFRKCPTELPSRQSDKGKTPACVKLTKPSKDVCTRWAGDGTRSFDQLS